MRENHMFKKPQYSYVKTSPHKPHLDGIRILLSAMVVSMADDVMGQICHGSLGRSNRQNLQLIKDLGRSDLKDFRNWDIFLLAKDSNCFDIPSAETINKWLENPKPFASRHTSEEYRAYQRKLYDAQKREGTNVVT